MSDESTRRLGVETPFGPVVSRLAGAPPPDGAASGGTASWRTDAVAVTLTVSQPIYEGVAFDVDGQHAWLWQIEVLRDLPMLQIATRLEPTAPGPPPAAGPVRGDWLLGVGWWSNDVFGAIGTSNIDALMVRRGDGAWLPERYLAADPTAPGTVAFITRDDQSLVATFAEPRRGERIAHHAAVAWAGADRESAVLDAIEVDDGGILRGAAPAPRRF